MIKVGVCLNLFDKLYNILSLKSKLENGSFGMMIQGQELRQNERDKEINPSKDALSRWLLLPVTDFRLLLTLVRRLARKCFYELSSQRNKESIHSLNFILSGQGLPKKH